MEYILWGFLFLLGVVVALTTLVVIVALIVPPVISFNKWWFDVWGL